MFQIPTQQNVNLALEKMPVSFTYSGLTRHMTAATATLKMATPTAVNMESTYHIRVRSNLPSHSPHLPFATELVDKLANESNSGFVNVNATASFRQSSSVESFQMKGYTVVQGVSKSYYTHFPPLGQWAPPPPYYQQLAKETLPLPDQSYSFHLPSEIMQHHSRLSPSANLAATD
ncbi:hypothetical protein PILCRDRAFT_11975 [Piloderma croceum F 1598]|uniref:Uncharacterized protein n=1 Tax=Piloderma croceum (strain F 1598) TaxID=765440 RepID=A0A0C3F036_PILCF|nr:hypothetical protein PILCRDRAFT_15301 [Piloderma croceum F 1598]KIM77549.1 hypothetical protein PILCRDRAFT_11975 [Piloderma croceum F 1598]